MVSWKMSLHPILVKPGFWWLKSIQVWSFNSFIGTQNCFLTANSPKRWIQVTFQQFRQPFPQWQCLLVNHLLPRTQGSKSTLARLCMMHVYGIVYILVCIYIYICIYVCIDVSISYTVYIYIQMFIEFTEPIEPLNIEPHSSQVHLSMFFLSYLLGIFSSNPGSIHNTLPTE